MINGAKYKKSKSQPEETIAERANLRRKKQTIKIYLICHNQKVMKKGKKEKD